MDIATLSRKLSSLAEFRLSQGSNGELQWRDSPGKAWRHISRFDARLFIQILNVRDWSRIQAAMVYLADSSHKLSSDYRKDK